MSYATTKEVVSAIGADVLAKLHSDTAYVPDLIKESRASAAAAIDSYIASQVRVPVDTARRDYLWHRLRDVEIALVRWREWQRADVENVPQIVRDQRDGALEWLAKVQQCRLPLLTGQNSGSMSVPFVRGTLVIAQTETLEFNAFTKTDGGLLEIEYADSGQAVFVARQYGFVEYASFRAYGKPGAEIVVSPTINGEPMVGALDLTWNDDVRRGYIDSGVVDMSILSGYSFSAGDRIGLQAQIAEPASLIDDVDVKVWLGLEYAR
jgi:phage gp36-like protein